MPRTPKQKGLPRTANRKSNELLSSLREVDMIGLALGVDWIAACSKSKGPSKERFVDKEDVAARELVDRLASMKNADCEEIIRGSKNSEPLKPVAGGVWPMTVISDVEEEHSRKPWRLILECEHEPRAGTLYKRDDSREVYTRIQISTEFLLSEWPPLDRRHYSRTKPFLAERVGKFIDKILVRKPDEIDNFTIEQATILLRDRFPEYSVHPMVELFKRVAPKRAKRGRSSANSNKKQIFEEFRNEVKISELKN